MTEHTCESTSE